MIARLYTGFPEPHRRCRKPVEISVVEEGTAVAILRKTIPARYTVRIADNDLDGYRW